MTSTGREPELIHEAVALQARLRPDAVAIRQNDSVLSYAALDANAEAYAAELIRLGVGPGAIVPVVLPGTPRLPTTLLAVLKTGAAYSALDHRWPREHIQSLITRLAPPLVLTDSGPVWGPPVSCPPEPTPRVKALQPVPRPPGLTGAAPAMVFFTSGTTGRPKGVLSPHRATLRLFAGETFAEFGPSSSMPQTAPVPWDAFALETWGMLTTGGTVVLVDDDYFLPDSLRDLVRDRGVTQIWLTASLFNLFVDEDIDAFRGLRRVLTGGERLSPEHVRRFLSAHPHVALVNGYGPVESCVFVSTHPITLEDCALPGGIPIGRPVPGTSLHVLDGTRPATGQGEICLAGTGLALRYLDDPEATARSFVTITVDGEPTRLYRTGDQGEFDADSVLHFRGRTDHQLKIAGHRVEPADIEAAVRAISGVRDCAVYPMTGPEGMVDRLALSYTADNAQAIDEGTLKRVLAERLPAYQVPTIVRRHSELPMTLSGKVDRAELIAQLTA